MQRRIYGGMYLQIPPPTHMHTQSKLVAHIRNLRPMILTVLPSAKSLGDSHSFTSSSDSSMTTVGKLAGGGGGWREGGEVRTLGG